MRLMSSLLVAFSLVFSVPVYSQEISEASVREFLGKFDEAISQKNAAKIAGHISDTAEFSGTVTSGGQAQSFRLNKAQYIAALRDVWAQASNYTYRRNDEKIAISGARVTVIADVVESMVIQGQYVSTRAREVSTIEKIRGNLMVTKVVANGSM